MKKSYIIFTVLFYFLVIDQFAMAYVAKSQMVRGSVTILPPGALEAHQLQKGEKIKKDSSIVTAKRSLAIVMMTNNSKLTIGPNSKIIISPFSTQKSGVVGLLTGVIRADVKKDAMKKGNKLFIKTRTAAMGVRGTSFQASFNSKNKTTSLLTFSGKVAMAKIVVQKKSVVKGSKVVTNEIVEMEKVLNKKQTVLVSTGQYASSVTGKTKHVAAVRISPKQFTLIKLDKSFGLAKKKISQKILKKEIEKTKEEFTQIRKQEKRSPIKEMKDGGYVDFKSGFYIPPTKKVSFDKASDNSKILREIGSVNGNGEYIPPTGMILDESKGFVAAKNNKAAQVKVAMLNNKIKNQVTKSKIVKNSLNDIDNDAYSKYYEELD